MGLNDEAEKIRYARGLLADEEAAPDHRQAAREFLSAHRHEPSRACDNLHCYVHHVDELFDAFRVCFECKHAYRTERELIDTFNAVMTQADAEAAANGWAPLEFVPVDDAEQIFFCPFCTHDF